MYSTTLSITGLLTLLTTLRGVSSLPAGGSHNPNLPANFYYNPEDWTHGSMDFFNETTCSGQEMIPTGPIPFNTTDCIKVQPASPHMMLKFGEHCKGITFFSDDNCEEESKMVERPEEIPALKPKSKTHLQQERSVTTAVLSSPDRIRLTEEEISDIFDYLGIKYLMSIPDDLENLHATSAAFAGYGYGLCRHYMDLYACEREEQHLPEQRLLHIDFTPNSLSGTIKSLNSARGGTVDDPFIDIDLGLGRLNTYPEEEEELYWTAVRGRIRSLVRSFKPRITQVILTGSSAGDGRFVEAVKDALYDLVSSTALDGLRTDSRDLGADGNGITADDFLYATAKGAAEFAKRRQEGPVRCAESEACKRVRKGTE
ncbi:MAG: hypothetical protein Q9208_006251 [Pyrenodesmia sp. 3 TL-2023]